MSYDVEGRLREVGGVELLERIAHLEAAATRPTVDAQLTLPDAAATPDFDVVMAGGGLWVTLAPLLARLGLRVAVVERTRAAAAHREWNASPAELEVLTRNGLFRAEELVRCVATNYERGVCRFHGGAAHEVRGVLDVALDASAYLTHVRDAAEAAGVVFLDGYVVDGVGAGPESVHVRATPRGAGARLDLLASVMIDARGAASPYASADLVCPTVGGVMAGLTEGSGPAEVDPSMGEILVTTEGIEEGRQHIWEGFPGRAGELTTYLFYYARRDEPRSLLRLYERFFRTLGRYKEGPAQLVRPTFGFIPGWSRLGPSPRSPSPRVVLVGDAAARHSPLTFCGFGSMLRRLGPVAEGVERLVRVGGGTDMNSSDEPIHRMTGWLAIVLASRHHRGEELNRLLDAAFSELEAMGNETYAALLQDRSSSAEIARFLWRTARRYPAAWREATRSIAPAVVSQWWAGVVAKGAS